MSEQKLSKEDKIKHQIRFELRPFHYAMCDEIKRRGGNVVREAGPMQHGSTVIAFVEDPDGYKVELIQKPA